MKTYAYTLTEELLQDVVQRLVEAGSPDKIILFGSRARGDFRPDSDLDLLVVDQTATWDREAEYRQSVEDLGVRIDVRIASPRDIAAWRNVPNHFLTVVTREGRVLYDRGDRIAEEPEAARNQLDYAREWLGLGDEDLEEAEFLLAGMRSNRIICFLAQQATEKYMKALLAYRGDEIPRIHELMALRQLLGWTADQVVADARLKRLSESAVEGRYGSRPAATREEAEEFVELANRVRQDVIRHLPEVEESGG